MSVLNKLKIEGRIALGPTHVDSIVITPFLKKREALDLDSIDLRLGSRFLLPSSWQQPFFSPDESSSRSLHLETHVPLGKYLVVPAHQTVLGATLEFIKLPFDLSGEIFTKSSVARTFIVVETAPWIHPGYRGCLTLEIANVSNTPVLLYPGRLIGQLILLENTGGTMTEKLSGKYIGPVYPEAPIFKSPVDDLGELGIAETWVIPKPSLQSYSLSARRD